MDMIERVARAMCDDVHARRIAAQKDAPSYDDSPTDVQQFWQSIARAAIEAMREPTEAMLAEGWSNSPVVWCDHPNTYERGEEALGYIYRAMISAALSENEGEA